MANTIPTSAEPAAATAGARRFDVQQVAMCVATSAVVPFAIAAVDLQVRPKLLTHAVHELFNFWGYWEGWALAAVVWFFALEAARDRRRAVRVGALVFIAFAAAFGIGGQAFFHRITFDYVDRRAVLLALNTQDVIVAYLREDFRAFVLFVGGSAVAAVLVAIARARILGPLSPRVPAAWLAVAALAAAMFMPIQGVSGQEIPPDELWFRVLGGGVLMAVGHASKPHTLPNGKHRSLPLAAPVAAEAPSIVVILGESVRRDHNCPDDGGPCVGGAIEAAAPNRIVYARASSIASCTEIASVALWTGRAVNSTSEEVAEAPLLFDYAKARGYRTAYLSSQNLVYQRLDAYLRSTQVDVLREARHRDASSSWTGGSKDEDTLHEAVEFVSAGGPSFVLAHLSNTHLPYRQDGIAGHPEIVLVPAAPSSRPRYDSGLTLEDVMLADFMRALRATPAGAKAIVIYISDHGEAWGEHGRMRHTQTVFNNEIDVPLWVDAPAESIAADTLERMRDEAGHRYVATQDVSATVIDLIGGLDLPAWSSETTRLAGRSLLRDADPSRVVLLSNCPTFRECVHPGFGALRWPFKFHTEDVKPRQFCTNIAEDPLETHPLPIERCGNLPAILTSSFRGRRSYPEK